MLENHQIMSGKKAMKKETGNKKNEGLEIQEDLDENTRFIMARINSTFSLILSLGLRNICKQSNRG